MTGRVCRIAAQSLAVASETAATVCQTIEGDLTAGESRVYTDRQTDQIRQLTDQYVADVLAVGRDGPT